MRTTNDLAARLDRLADRVTRVDAAALGALAPLPRASPLPPADPTQPPRCQRATLPMAPSANHLWQPIPRPPWLVRSRQYRDWLIAATSAVACLRPVERYPVLVLVTVYGGKGFRRSRDVPNCEKCCVDLLVTTGVLRGDSVLSVTETRSRYVEADAPGAHAVCTVAVIEGHVVRAES